MKRLILSLTVIALSFGLSAQNEMPGGTQGEEFPGKSPMLKFDKNEKLNESSDWFNFYQEMSQLSSGWTSFLDYLFPDSTVQWVGSSGAVFAWKLAQGQVLDPTSQYFLFDTKSISKAANYTLDSIAIQYAYRRTQTANPDTLLIQVFKTDSMGYTPLPSGWTTPRSYCRPLYDDVANKGIGAIKEIKRVLTIADTAVTFSRTLFQEIGVDVDPDEEIAISVHYIPGNPYKVGDTLSRTLDGPNVINNFAMYNGRDEGKTDDNDFYNHSLMITNTIRYGINTNNWNGKYYPGVAFGAGIYHSNIYFKLTFDDYTGIKESKVLKHLDVYPNPSSSFVNVEYDVNYGQKVSLEFTNILGHKVYQETLPLNGSKTRVDVSNWTKGLYFYSLIVDGQIVGTERLVVSE